MENVKNHLGDRLKELRGDRPLHQIEKASGIDRGQLRRYEAGRIPQDHLVVRLSEFYQVPYEELKALCFEDLFPKGGKEREALLKWALNVQD
jgi:transcriptional regulator with XRE-family HTH domain